MTIKHFSLSITASVVLVMTTSAHMANAETARSGYHLFNPTPAELMREMSTDRPDKTESPYTVDAGHFQLESDLVSYVYDKDDANGNDVRTRSLGIVPINFKGGLTESTDLQIVIENYVYEKTSDKGSETVDTVEGFGDITIRLKQNIWGNDGGASALAVMPFVKLPTNTNNTGNDHVEGGVIVPLALSVGHGLGLGLMAEVDWMKDADENGYHAVYIASATIGYDISDRIGHYVELFAEESMEDGTDTVITFDTGLTYALTDDVQLDAGVNIGLTSAAEDLNPFLGVSMRF